MSASTKKNKILLLLLAALFTSFIGLANDRHERAILYTDKPGNKNTNEETVKNKELSSFGMFFEEPHNQELLLLTNLTFTVCCSLLVYFLVKAKYKRERFMESYITETRIAKKVHDEIANELYEAVSYLGSKKEISEENRKKLIVKLDNIYLMTKNISRETSNIETGYDFPEHLKVMLTGYSGDKVNIITKGLADIKWNNVNALKKIATYRSLQELMVNMKKHSGASLVIIDFSLNGKKIEISYIDNGNGINKEKTFSKSGLLNIEKRMASIEGHTNLNKDIEKGFHIILSYPAYTKH
ncbi:MAG: hypothetical protein DI539_03390 [Flavobacterium psychrophilum]|nr:MAG: hypothetical protein DI539_03390 [Flavobacterium psychrophilum]